MGLLSGSSRKTYSTLSPEQRRVAGKLGTFFESNIGKPLQQYPGQITAPMSQYEKMGLGYLQNYLSDFGNYMQSRQNVYGKAVAGGLLPKIDASESARVFREEIEPSFQRRLGQFMGQAREEAKGAGAQKSSSAMNRAVVDRAAEAAETLNMMEYNRMREVEAAEWQRDAQIAQLRMQAAQMPEPERMEQLSMVQASQQLGALPRLIEQAENDAVFQEWLRTRPEYSPVLSQALDYLKIQMVGQYMKHSQGALGDIKEVTGGIADIVGNVGMIGTSIGGLAMGGLGGLGSMLGGLGGAAGGATGGSFSTLNTMLPLGL